MDRFSNFLSRFTYRQRFIFWSLIFACTVPWPAYWVLATQNFYIERLHQKLDSLYVQDLLGDALTNVLKKRLASAYQTDQLAHEDFASLKHKIKEDLDLLNHWQTLHSVLERNSLLEEKTPIASIQSFDNLLQLVESYFSKSEQVVVEKAYAALVEELQAQIIYNAYAYNLILDLTPGEKPFENLILFQLPREQVLLTELAILALKISRADQNEASLLIDFIATRDLLSRFVAEKQKEDFLFENDYYTRYLVVVNNLLEDWQGNNFSKDVLWKQFFLVQKAIGLNAKSRLEAIRELHHLFEKKLNFFNWLRGMSLFVLIFASSVIAAYVIFRILTSHLLQLDGYLKNMQRGDFSHSINVNLKDEIGQIIVEFNKMKDSFKKVIEQLQELGKQLGDLSKKIKRNATANEVDMVQQKETIEHLFSNIHELALKLRELDQTLNMFAETSNEFLFLDNQQTNGMEFILDRMETLADMSEKILNTLNTVSEKISSTRRLTKFMSKISDQAKLLSLNAGIETLGIGPHHSEFADITKKIEHFAFTTAYSTQDIQQIISEMSKSVTRGKATADTCLKEINAGANRLITVSLQLGSISLRGKEQVGRFTKVRQTMRGQVEAAEHLLGDIQQLDNLLESNILNFHTLLERIETITKKSEEHNQMLARFFILKKEAFNE